MQYENDVKDLRLQRDRLSLDREQMEKERQLFEESRKASELELSSRKQSQESDFAAMRKELEELKDKAVKVQLKLDAKLSAVEAEKKQLNTIRVIVDAEQFSLKKGQATLSKRESELDERQVALEEQLRLIVDRENAIALREQDREKKDRQLAEFQNVLNDGT